MLDMSLGKSFHKNSSLSMQEIVLIVKKYNCMLLCSIFCLGLDDFLKNTSVEKLQLST